MPAPASEPPTGGRDSTAAPAEAIRARRILRRVMPFVAPLLIALALWLLHGELARFRYADLVGYLRSLERWQLLLALALTAASFTTPISYDVLAFRYLGRDLANRRIALAGFIGYAFSNNVGTVLGCIPLRFRLYTAWGIPAPELLRLIAFTIGGFWLAPAGLRVGARDGR